MCAACLVILEESPHRLQQRVQWLFLSPDPAFRKGCFPPLSLSFFIWLQGPFASWKLKLFNAHNKSNLHFILEKNIAVLQSIQQTLWDLAIRNLCQ